MKKILATIVVAGVVGALFMDSFTADAAAEQYITVQRGESTITGASSLDVDITAVDTTRSFILVSNRGEGTLGAQDPYDIFVTAEFVDTDTIRLKRYDDGTADDAVVAWQVVTANANAPTQAFEVQTGEVLFDYPTYTTTRTASITDITDTSNAMILTQTRWENAIGGVSRVYTRATFDDSSTIRLTRDTSFGVMSVRYWVIKWSSDFTVRKGSVAMTTSATANDTFSAVDTSRSLIFMTHSTDSDGLAQTRPKAHLASGTQINFERETALNSVNIEYAVVEFPTGNSGQSNSADWAGTGYSDTTAITAVDLDATILTASNEVTGTGSAFPRGVITTRLSDANTVTMQTSYDGNTTTVSWTLVDTSGWTFETAGEVSPSVASSTLKINNGKIKINNGKIKIN